MSGKPSDSSRIGRIRTFYTSRPDEQLTRDDICLKLDCEAQQADKLVYHLRQLKFLETVPGTNPVEYRRTEHEVTSWRIECLS